MADNTPASQTPSKLQPGDLCHHGSNALPLYRVVWIDEGKAWVRDVNNGQDSVVQLGACRVCTPDEIDGQVLEPITPEPLRWPDGTPRP